MDGTVLRVCHDAESDDFLGLLQELTDIGECKQPKEEATPTLPSDIGGGRVSDKAGSGGEKGAHRAASRGVVGLSPAELESLNELIHIDHYYVKPQPMDLAEEPSEEVIAPEHAHKLENSIQSPKDEFHVSQAAASSAGVKRTLTGKPVVLQSPATNSLSQNFLLGHTDVDIVVGSSEVPTTPDISFNGTDDLICALSDSGMEEEAPLSLNFLDQLDLEGSDASVSNIFAQTEKPLLVVSPQDAQTRLKTSELDSAKLFDEIYEHYVSMKDSSSGVGSPLSSSASDSEFNSESAEVLSPWSSEGSLLEDLPWHDSFTELFPDLQ